MATVCDILKKLEFQIDDIYKRLAAIGVRDTTGEGQFTGALWEVSDDQIAVWSKNTTRPLSFEGSGKWARLKAGRIEAYGDAFEFKSGASGARILIDSQGLRLYSDTEETVKLDATTGDATFKGTIHASAGDIAGWTIGADKLYKNNAELRSSGELVLGTGSEIVFLSAVNDTFRLWVGDENPTDAPFSVQKTGHLYSSKGQIGGWTIAETYLQGGGIKLDATQAKIEVGSGANIVIDGTNKLIKTSNFSSGIRGWQINYDGNAEFNNVLLRGELQATVLRLNVAQCLGSLFYVMPATKLIADVSPTDTTIDVADNIFEAGDYIYLHPAADRTEWMKITDNGTSISGGYRYSVTRDCDGGGADSFYKDEGVLNTGQRGDGWIALVGGFTYRPNRIDIVKREGFAHYDWTTKVSLGNLSGLSHPRFGSLSGYGLFAQDGYFTGKLHAASGNIAGWEITADRIRGSQAYLMDNHNAHPYPSYALVTVGCLGRCQLARWLIEGEDSVLSEFYHRADGVWLRHFDYIDRSNWTWSADWNDSHRTTHGQDEYGSTGRHMNDAFAYRYHYTTEPYYWELLGYQRWWFDQGGHYTVYIEYNDGYDYSDNEKWYYDSIFCFRHLVAHWIHHAKNSSTEKAEEWHSAKQFYETYPAGTRWDDLTGLDNAARARGLANVAVLYATKYYYTNSTSDRDECTQLIDDVNNHYSDWGQSFGSPLATYSLILAAWLIDKYAGTNKLSDIQSNMTSELNYWHGQEPESGYVDDSKAESNAWTAAALYIGGAAYDNSTWKDDGKKWAYFTFCWPSDSYGGLTNKQTIYDDSSYIELMPDGIIGWNNTTKEFWISAADGKGYFAGGDAILSDEGIKLKDTLVIRYQPTGTDDVDVRATLSIVQPIPTGDTDGHYRGVFGVAESNLADVNFNKCLIGVFGYAYHASPGTAHDIHGVYAEVNKEDGAGTVAESAAFSAYFLNKGGEVTTGWLFRGVACSNAGTIGTMYGLYIPTLSGNTRFAIYTEGLDDIVQFGGEVRMRGADLHINWLQTHDHADIRFHDQGVDDWAAIRFDNGHLYWTEDSGNTWTQFGGGGGGGAPTDAHYVLTQSSGGTLPNEHLLPQIDVNIIPDADLTRGLGDAAHRWDSLHVSHIWGGDQCVFLDDTNKRIEFYADGATRAYINANALDLSPLSTPSIWLDGNDEFRYDKTNDRFVFYIGGTACVFIHAHALDLTPLSTPSIWVDGNDEFRYDKSNDRFVTYIGGTEGLYIGNEYIARAGLEGRVGILGGAGWRGAEIQVFGPSHPNHPGCFYLDFGDYGATAPSGAQGYVRYLNDSSATTIFEWLSNQVKSHVDFDVSGNITVSGTVDGVDIAAFKSSYDSHVGDANAHHEKFTAADHDARDHSAVADTIGLNELGNRQCDSDQPIYWGGNDLYIVGKQGSPDMLDFYTAGSLRLRIQDNDTVSCQNFWPSPDGSYTLGKSNRRWTGIYGQHFYKASGSNNYELGVHYIDPTYVDRDNYDANTWYTETAPDSVPSGATAILVKVTIRDGAAGRYVVMCHPNQSGATYWYQTNCVRTQAANTYIDGVFIVPIDSNRQFKWYKTVANGSYFKYGVFGYIM